MILPDFEFYQTEYGGRKLDNAKFDEYVWTAGHKFDHFDRTYTLIGGEKSKNLALCALAEVLAGYADAEEWGNPSSATIGSVSVALSPKDLSAKALNRDCLDAVRRFLDVYRGRY